MAPGGRPWNHRSMQRSRAHATGEGQPLEQAGWIFEIGDRAAAHLTTAEILEVLHVPGYRAYHVRWQDGSESTFIPSSGHHAHPPTAAGH
jgi:hypothetical protein